MMFQKSLNVVIVVPIETYIQLTISFVWYCSFLVSMPLIFLYEGLTIEALKGFRREPGY
jgi:hypothetical protein